MDDVGEEVWAPVQDFELYIVSNYGNIQHKNKEMNRKPYLNAQGFPSIVLFRDGVKSRYVRQINKLVAQAFLPPPEYDDLDTVWHLDGDLLNLRWDNLKWERRDRTMEWNRMHRERTPRFKTPRVMNNQTGTVYANAFECALAEGTIELSIISHIERYPDQYADHARWRYVE